MTYSATAPVKLLAGTAGAPGVTFTTDTDTGLYRPGPNEIAVAVGGVEKARFTGSGMGIGGDITLDDGVAGPVTTLQTITATANRTISLPDATGTVALVAGSSGQLVWNNAGAQAGVSGTSLDTNGNITLTANRLINNTAGSIFDATSTTTQNNTGSPFRVTGTWLTAGGTTTTTKPQVLVEPAGTTSTAWSTAGTGLGVNAASGFLGRLLDLQLNGTSNFSVDSTGRVSVPLGTAALPSIYPGTDTNTGIYSPGADQVAISTGGTGRLFVDASGNVGVGISSPQVRLHLGIENVGSDRVYDVAGAYNGLAFNSWVRTGTSETVSDIIAWGDKQGGPRPTSLRFLTAPNSANAIPAERLRIDPAGRVGIGTTSPGSALEINAAAATSPFIAKINTAEVARIDSSGRLLVGTSTSTSVGGSAATVQILGTGSNPHSLQLTRDDSPLLVFGKTSVGGGANVLGAVVFAGNDTNDLNSVGATIAAFVDGTIGVDDLPTRLVFSTTADGSASPTERMRITSDGTTLIQGNIAAQSGGSTRTITLGTASAGLECNVDGTTYLSGRTDAFPLAFRTNSTERARIDSSGRLLVGTSTARSNFSIGGTGYAPQTQLEGGVVQASFVRAVSPYIGLAASNTAAGETSTGNISFFGNDGTNLIRTAEISSIVDGTPGTGDMPGRLVFSTTADGAASPTERLRITSAGQIQAGGLGTATAPIWSFLADPNTGIYSPGADQVAISTNGTGRLFVDASGSVGLGTSQNPTTGGFPRPVLYLKQFSDSVSGFAGIHIEASGDQSVLGIGYDGTAQVFAFDTSFRGTGARRPIIFKTTGAECMRIRSDGMFEVKGAGTAGSSPAFSVNGSAPANSAVIDTNGRLGIGTSNPSAKTEIVSSGSESTLILRNASSANSTYSELKFAPFTGTTAAAAALRADYYTNNASTLAFRTTATNAEPTTKLFIDPSGNVGIGTTSPGALLHLSQAGSAAVGPEIRLNNSSNSAGDKARISFFGGGSPGSIRGALDFNIQMGGNGELIWSSGSGGVTERFRCDGSGRLLVGTSTARANFYNSTNSPQFQIEGNDNSKSALAIIQDFNANTLGAQLVLAKNNSTTVGTNVLVVNNDTLGSVSFQGNDGTEFVEGASITAAVDGTSGANDLPTRLVFSTTADGAAVPTERLRITSAGQIQAGGLGTAAAPVLSFLADPDTGLYSPGANQLSISTAGTQKFTIDSFDGNPIIETSYPMVRPTLDLNFAATRRLDPRVTFSRASTGTFVGSNGLIQTAASGQARFEHNPTTGESLGLLVEEARTNRVAWSFGRTLFTRSFCTVNTFTGSLVVGEIFTSVNAGTFRLIRYSGGIAHFLGIAGDQNIGAVPLTATSGIITSVSNNSSSYNTGVTDGVWINYSPAFVTSVLGNTVDIASGRWGFQVLGKTAGAGCICSIFVKVLDLSVDRIVLTQNGGGDGDTTVTYTLSSDTFGSLGGSGAGSAIYGVQKFPNGWHRLHWGRPSMAGTNPGFLLAAQNSAGTEVNGGVYLDGGQVEDAAFMTSYIPTTGATVTRAADVAIITGSSFSSFWNPSTGSIKADFRSLITGTRPVVSFDDNTANNRIELYTSTTSSKLTITAAGSPQADITAGTASATLLNRQSISYSSNDFAAVLGGATAVTDTSGSVPIVSQLRLGADQVGNSSNAPISRFSYWPIKLDQTTLQAVTR